MCEDTAFCIRHLHARHRQSHLCYAALCSFHLGRLRSTAFGSIFSYPKLQRDVLVDRPLTGRPLSFAPRPVRRPSTPSCPPSSPLPSLLPETHRSGRCCIFHARSAISRRDQPDSPRNDPRAPKRVPNPLRTPALVPSTPATWRRPAAHFCRICAPCMNQIGAQTAEQLVPCFGDTTHVGAVMRHSTSATSMHTLVQGWPLDSGAA